MSKTKQSPVSVIQNPAAPVAVEILAESIVAISQGVKKLLAGPLNETALLLLITHACPPPTANCTQRVGQRDVRAVLSGIQALESEYLKPRKPL